MAHRLQPLHPPQPGLRGYYYDGALSRVLTAAQKKLLMAAVGVPDYAISGSAEYAAARVLARLGLVVLIARARGGRIVLTPLGRSFFDRNIFDPVRDCAAVYVCSARGSRQRCKPGCALETLAARCKADDTNSVL